MNVFSPNGDEQNDELVFKYLTSFPGNKLTIFDRWGNLVYQKSNYGNNWRAEDVAGGYLLLRVLTIPGQETISQALLRWCVDAFVHQCFNDALWNSLFAGRFPPMRPSIPLAGNHTAPIHAAVVQPCVRVATAILPK